jgi:hypothetical protein
MRSMTSDSSSINRFELRYNATKWGEYCVSLQTSVVLTQGYNVIVNSEELIGTTKYVTLYRRFSLNQCRYNRVLVQQTTKLAKITV